MGAISTIRSLPGRLDIEAWRGDDFALTFQVVSRLPDGTRTPIDLTGFTPTMQARRSAADDAPIDFTFEPTQSQPDTGVVTLTLAGAASADMHGSYLYSIEFQAGALHRTLLAGGLYVHDENSNGGGTVSDGLVVEVQGGTVEVVVGGSFSGGGGGGPTISADPDNHASLGTDGGVFVGPDPDLGDTSLLVEGIPEHDLVHWLIRLEHRVAELEAGAPITPPTPEGALEVDLYGGSFVRLRDTANILGDGQVHIVNVVLATVAGPGGEVFPPASGVPAGNAGTWFDSGGTLGPVVGATGSTVTQTTVRNWAKYPDSYLLWVNRDDVTDPARPRLVVDRVGSFS